MTTVETEEPMLIMAPGAALVLAALGALALVIGDAVGFDSEAAETIYVGTSMLGMMSLACGAIITSCCAVLLVRRLFRRRSVSPVYVTILVAALAIIVVTFAQYPLWHSGTEPATYPPGR